MSFDPIAYLSEPRWRESRLGLGRMRALLDRVGAPERGLSFTHVAGTNGNCPDTNRKPFALMAWE